MQTVRLTATVSALAGLSVLGLGHASQAQTVPPVTLSLISPVSTASVGDTLTFTLNLTGGTDINSFTTVVTLSNSDLSFVGASPFTETFSGLGTNLANDVNKQGALEISYGVTGNDVNNTGTNALGTFQVHVDSPLPAGGTFLTLTAPSDPSSADPSAVTNGATGDNELTAVGPPVAVLPAVIAPEPSGAVAGLVGLAGLGLLAARRRRSA